MTIPPPARAYPEDSQSVTVFVLGLLSIITCQVLGPFAWKMGNDEVRAITEGRRSPENVGLAQAGRICGIVGTCLLALFLVFFILWLVLLMLGVIGAFSGEWRSR